MKSVKTVPSLVQGGFPLHLKDFAIANGVAAPVSVKNLLRHFTTATFHADVTVSDPDALGGTADLTIHADGAYELVVEMHDSGFPDYSYRIVASLRAANVPYVLALYDSASVLGTISGGGDRRTSRDPQDGVSAVLAQQWDDFAAGTFRVDIEYKDDELAWIASSLIEKITFTLGCATIGGPAASMIWCASLLGKLGKDARLPGELGLAGLIASEAAFFLCGPTMMVPVFIAGVAVSAALFKRRSLHDDEKAVAYSVFKDTVPYDQVWITNLEGPGGAAIAVPDIDGGTVIGVGNARYDNMVSDPDRRMTLIHELTHAWQVANKFLVETICSGAHNAAVLLTKGKDNLYYGDDPLLAQRWSDLNTEEQAVVISLCDSARQAVPPDEWASLAMDHYIRENILLRWD